MSDIDREIEKALSAEDRELARQFEELGLIGQFTSVFKGPTAFISAATMIAGVILTGLFFYTVWQFVVISDLNEKLLWGGGALFLAMGLGFIKVWFFIRMESNRVMREIKRVELQIARLQL